MCDSYSRFDGIFTLWGFSVHHVWWGAIKHFHNSLRWRHNDHAGVSNHQPHGCLLNRLFRRKSKKTSKLRVTGLWAGNSPGTGEFPAQMASYAENVSIWWRHHVFTGVVFSLACLYSYHSPTMIWYWVCSSAEGNRCFFLTTVLIMICQECPGIIVNSVRYNFLHSSSAVDKLTILLSHSQQNIL